jgi:hypothetical protein
MDTSLEAALLPPRSPVRPRVALRYLECMGQADAHRFTKGDRAGGRYYQLIRPMHAGMQLDLFLAQPDNWGLTLLVRTGPIVAHGPPRLSAPPQGVRDGAVIRGGEAWGGGWPVSTAKCFQR